ncbi:cation efflux family-domain-containing protein [Hypoxylon trugodes]|uniref:cation efflux family-domain-containing protein n=1 Tax=Hypoxylon trugodes TaxID=326681 RepID=UPI002193353D|nr:cation efflux family-domain-containing protein [Hypoxylon trugodes]KAI1391317.1 cation efflux family-domain-containing protein [Hypoxylon trugodes]
MGSEASPSTASQAHANDEKASLRSSAHTPVSPPRPSRDSFQNATSTGVEAMNDSSEQPIARHPSAVTATDVEAQTGNARYRGSDPYNLSSALKTAEQLDEIKANTARKRTTRDDSNPSKIASTFRARKIQTFYHKQNDTIKQMLKSVEEHEAEAQREAGEDHLRFQIAQKGSFAANVILSILQIYGAVSSSSLSLFTTMADAIFDPLSNATLILTQHAMKRVDPSRFPSGKARLETVGNITFCFMMTAVSAILIAFSCQDIATRVGTGAEVNNFHLPSVLAVCIAFATKLALFFYCWGIKDKYSQVNILWQDHRNDLLINGFGVLTSVGGSKLVWWIDPMGAIIISVIISGAWLHQAFTEFMTLVGKAADIDIQQLITYICVTYSDSIQSIDTVRVYHSGPRLIAEVDIVMHPDEPLRNTHDVSEGLQIELEKLPNIERAYVHTDYETTHKPEHGPRKDL